MTGSTSPVDPGAVAVLISAASRGAEFRLTPDGLRLRPPAALTPEERRRLHGAGPGTATAIARELAWRVEAMQRQVPPAPRPVPMLTARPGKERKQGTCVSCGESLVEAERTRCGLCALAAWDRIAGLPAEGGRGARTD